jgi:hypothetical protein
VPFWFFLLIIIASEGLRAQEKRPCGHWWLTVILATQKVEIRRIEVQSQPEANSLGDPISKLPNPKKTWKNQNRAGGLAQMVRAPA